MSPTANWTTPSDIRTHVERSWERGQILAAGLTGQEMFPLPLPLRRPDARALSERFDEVRAWIRALEDGSKARLSYGYEIEWDEINHRLLGRNRVPCGIRLPTEADALKLIGRQRQAAQFRSLADITLARLPALGAWLARRPLLALGHADDWQRVLAVLSWFIEHPRPAVYLRQLDIPGVDTKFIESNRGLLSELLDVVLPGDAVDRGFAGSRNFEQRYGLSAKPPLIRFRLLDERLYLGGLSDLTVPASEFARLALPLERVFITENDVNGLAFPDVPGGIVVFGLGYGLDLLARIDWLKTRKLYYWGDIDTHGFAILSRLRLAFPEAGSFLMDRETLMLHRDLWGREGERHLGSLGGLSAAEEALFDDLRYDRIGDRVRLEQERIRFGLVRQTVQTLAGD